ncbi:uncharacterized protein BDV17DRAFT_287700 [Aspergillus undulatus]|uniref:uncharacterized protein n=1 Tax=Aspergillus undulatus TaxID=1810928 RepID=UPI003CCD5255
MKYSITTVLVSLCAAALAAPTRVSRAEKRLFPFPFPGEGGESPEPSESFPAFPFPTESGETPESSGFPFYANRGGSCGGEGLGESPLGSLSEFGEELPWSESGEEEGSGFPSILGGEETGMENEEMEV